jgi:hypothetical protein
MFDGLNWIPAVDESSSLLLSTISKIARNFELPECPICMNATIRFYYRVSEFQPDFVTKNNKVRGTIWVWCPSCLHWTHSSGVALPKNIIYTSNLTKTELQKIKGAYMINNLNRLWEKGRLPESFTLVSENE